MRHLSVPRAPWIVAGVLAVCTLTACDNSLAPYHPEIVSITDSFQLQATGVKDVTETLTYSWTNTGTTAKVSHSTTTSKGSARIVIRDAAHNVVYDATLQPSLEEDTTGGTAGVWTIELHLSGYSGTLNFRVQKN